MALRTFVKVSAINNLSDARYCAGMGVDMLGFPLDPHAADSVSEAKFKEITNWLSGIAIVGEVDTIDAEAAANLLSRYQLDYLQTSQAESVAALADLGIPLILKVPFVENEELSTKAICSAAQPYVSYFLLESDNEVLTEIELSYLKRLANRFPILLGFGFNSNSINHVLDVLPAKGIALKGSDEIRPGFKDYDQLADILEALEAEE